MFKHDQKEAKYMPKKESIIVLSVDRDNDVGEKTSHKGPIIGKDNVLKSAIDLGLADPEDSDFNALFQAIRLSNEMKNQYNTEVAVLTGDKNVGVQSDREITRQLNHVLNKFKADYAVLVSDGPQDEDVLPIIQSRVPILSINRVVVKQSERLESGYYKIKEFIEETLEKPKVARLLFGLPAIFLILYSLFGFDGWRIIIGIVGIYLFLKGFKIDDYIHAGFNELNASFTRRRFAFFTYIVGIAVGILATYWGYEAATTWINIGIFELVSAFISGSVYFYFIAAAIAWVGKSLSTGERRGKTIASVVIFGFAISIVIYNAAELIVKPDISMVNFIFSIILGFALILAALLMELKK
jgi:putative membrane protein